MKDKVHISRAALLRIKESGKYSCPHYVPPSCMKELLEDTGISADDESTKLLAEVAENFACALIGDLRGGTLTVDHIIDRVNLAALT